MIITEAYRRLFMWTCRGRGRGGTYSDAFQDLLEDGGHHCRLVHTQVLSQGREAVTPLQVVGQRLVPFIPPHL